MNGEYKKPEHLLQQAAELALSRGMDGISTSEVCAIMGLTTHHAHAYLAEMLKRGVLEASKGPNNRWGPVGIFEHAQRLRKAQRKVMRAAANQRRRKAKREAARLLQKPRIAKPEKCTVARDWKPPVFIPSVWHFARDPINLPLGPRA